MKVVYYLEPWIEMGWPGFRFGSLDGYLYKEISGLINEGHDVRLVVGDGLEQEAKRRGFKLSQLTHKVIRQKHLRKIFPDYYKASIAWYNETYTQEQEDAMCFMMKNVLEDFVPDIIVSWESPIPFMKKLFPEAVTLYSNYGAVSRHPFPATQAFDHVGLFKNSYIATQMAEVVNMPLTKLQAEMLSEFRNKTNHALKIHNPFKKMDLKNNGRFERCILLPLQVSGYYAFDGNVPYKSQFDFLCSVLEEVPHDTRVIVTEHNSFGSIFNDRTLGYLKGKYPHFFYHEKFTDVKGSSQYLLSMVDAVIGVTSSVLLQAVLLDKPIKVIGGSHITPFSCEHGLHRVERIVNRHKKGVYDSFIYHLLTKYWIFQEHNAQNGKWLSSFFEDLLIQHRAGGISSSFYVNRKVDDIKVMKTLIDEISLAPPTMLARKKTIIVRDETIMVRRTIQPTDDPIYRDSKNIIDDSEWVSFDIFDTLVKRTVAKPSDLFILVGEKEQDILNVSPEIFRHARITAERKVRSGSRLEEVTIDEIYLELNKTLKLTELQIKRVLKSEVDAECKVCVRRESGIELLEYARDNGKKVYLISDMYLLKPHIMAILLANGIQLDENHVYVSSEERLQKHSGNLFKHFLSTEKLKVKKGVHIGDHPKGDGEMPEQEGIKSIVLPKAIEKMKENKSFAGLVKQAESNLCASVTAALISNRLYDRVDQDTDGLSAGHIEHLGYSTMGPLLLGFAAWIKHDAQQRGITDLFFLARDGKVMKQAYDLYCSYTGSGAKSHYMYASRRSINVPLITSIEQIYEILGAPFAPCPLKVLLERRFGITSDMIPKNILVQVDINAEVARTDDTLYQKVSKLEEIILQNASEEKVLLEQYIKQVGLGGSNQAIVDIGYRGSMQESLSRLINQHLHGYYLVTKDEIGALPSSAYLANKVNKGEKFAFWQGVALAEWLTLDSDTSVVKFKAIGGKIVPEFAMQQSHDIFRAEVTNIVHGAAFAFMSEWLKSPHKKMVPNLDTVKSTYFELLANPGLNDVHLLEKSVLEDGYGGHEERRIIETISHKISKKELNELVRSSAWKGGANVLAASYKPSEVVAHIGKNDRKEIVFTLTAMKVTKRKLNKLVKEPYWFFNDSSNKSLRRLRHFFKPY